MAQTATYERSSARARGLSKERAIAGAIAGVGAGIVFLLLSMIYAAIVGPGVWAPPRMMATIVGFEMAPVFAAIPVVVSLALHMVLSALYGAVFALLMGSAGRGIVLLAGLVFGLALYVLNFHVFAQLEQFAAFRMMAGNWFEIAVHVVFGLLLAAGFLSWRAKQGQGA